MSSKIILIIFFLLMANTTWALNLSGSLDISGQYNSNFLEAGLYEEAATLITGEADYSTQIKFNLSSEHNPSENMYSKLEYILDTLSYNKNTALNSIDNTFGLQVDRQIAADTTLRLKASAKRHYEEEIIKKYLQGILLIKGAKKLNPNFNLELSYMYDNKHTDNKDPRDYFAYMSYYQNCLGARFRYKLRRDLISKLRIGFSIKRYEHEASNYLDTVFPTLNQARREDQNRAVNLDLTKVFHENLLADVILGYIDNSSNISYYEFSGLILNGSIFSYWLGSRWQLKYDYGNYNYPNRSGVGFSQEELQSNKYTIGFRREIRESIYLKIKWEGIRNSSNNPANNFNNDTYTLGMFLQL